MTATDTEVHMSTRYELRLSGAGGHGLLLAGKVIAEAVAIYDGRTATQAQSYGPEARGGVSRSDLVISDGDIDFPVASELDLLLAMTQESVGKYIADVKDGGLVIVDESLVDSVPDGDYRVVRAPIVETAREKVGRPITANLVAVGLIAGLTDIVTVASLESAVRARVPRGTEEANLKALAAGLELSERLKG
jgi:2-oxoglutarate ferredoxin oxidoreductase subunit gamma